VGEDKAYLVRHRLAPVARAAGCRSFEELARKLRGPDGAALHDPIVEAITTPETSFFRDERPFEAFRRELLPRLGEAARRGGRVRLWCAAAATGQEAYSLAMLADEHAGAGAAGFTILATDISERVLEKARAAAYTAREVAQGLTPGRLARHFERRGEAWVVRERVRRLVEFRRVNLMGPLGALGTFDAVFCRNVLIYFDVAARRGVCRRLHAALNPGGWLVLGAAENLYGVSDQFEAVRFADALVYRKPVGDAGRQESGDRGTG
jgi:chemotaxis protein methyltransferase CheR